MSSSLNPLRWAVIALYLGMASAHAQIADPEIDLLLDTDNDAATGCTVATADGAFEGVELRLRTRLDISSAPSITVAQVTRAECVDPATDSFGPDVEENAGGWPVGVGLGVDGSHVVETALSQPMEGAVRMAVVSRGGAIEDALLTSTGDSGGEAMALPGISLPPQAIPAVSALGTAVLVGLLLLVVVRTRGLRSSALSVVLVVCIAGSGIGLAWAVALDGDPSEWQEEMLLGQDPSFDGNPDIVVLYAQRTDHSTLAFRVDAFID